MSFRILYMLFILSMVLFLIAMFADVKADTVYCTGTNPCSGTENADTIYGSSGYDEIHALGGIDYVDVSNGDDLIYLGDGDDHVFVTQGDKTIYTGNGNDVLLVSGNGHGTVHCDGTGNKTIAANDFFGHPTSTINCGPGNDAINVGVKAATVNAGAGNDVVTAPVFGVGEENHTLNGEEGDDNLECGTAEDTLDGGGDNDTLRCLLGSATMIGGSGNDTLIMGAGDSINYGGLGSDKFAVMGNSLNGGDKEIDDFDSSDFLDFSYFPGLTLESLLPYITFVEAPPQLQLMATAREQAAARKEFKKHQKNQRQWKKIKVSGKTIKDALRKKQPKGKLSNNDIFMEMRKQLQPKIHSGLIGDALALDIPVDMLIDNGYASILVRNGYELVVTEQLTAANFIFVP